MFNRFRSQVKKTISFFWGTINRGFSRERDLPEITDVIITIIDPLGMGDFLMMAPYIASIPPRFPNSRVTLVTNHTPAFHCAHVRWVRPDAMPSCAPSSTLLICPDISFRAGKFLFSADFIIGFFYSNQPYSNFAGRLQAVDMRRSHYAERIKTLLRALDISSDTGSYESITVPMSPTERFQLNHPYVVIAPISNWPTRQYSLDRWNEIIERLSDLYQVVLIGTMKEAILWRESKSRYSHLHRGRIEPLDLMGDTSLSEVNAIISKASLVVANDSGVAHIGSLLGPTITVYGCCGPAIRQPLLAGARENVIAFSNGESCQHFPCFEGYGEPVCVNSKRYSCLDIDAESVILQSQKVLSGGVFKDA